MTLVFITLPGSQTAILQFGKPVQPIKKLKLRDKTGTLQFKQFTGISAKLFQVGTYMDMENTVFSLKFQLRGFLPLTTKKMGV